MLLHDDDTTDFHISPREYATVQKSKELTRCSNNRQAWIYTSSFSFTLKITKAERASDLNLFLDKPTQIQNNSS